MQNLLDNWLGWLGLGGAGLAALTTGLWFMGLMPIVGAVLNIFSTVLSVVAPFLNMIAKAVAEGLDWLFRNVLFPGLKDIADSWATIATVVVMGAILWFGLLARTEVRVLHAQKQANVCVDKLKRTSNEEPPEVTAPVLDLPWPFKW